MAVKVPRLLDVIKEVVPSLFFLDRSRRVAGVFDQLRVDDV